MKKSNIEELSIWAPAIDVVDTSLLCKQ